MEFIGIALVLGAHLSFTKSDLNAVVRDFRAWQEEQKKLSEQFKEDLFEKCAETTMNVNKLCLHFAAFAACVAVRMMGQQWDVQSACSFLCSLVAYSLHAFFGRVRMSTGNHVHRMSLGFLLFQNLLIFLMWNETDLERLLCNEKFSALSVIFGSLMTLDFKWTLPMHVLSSLISTYKHWQLVGFETVTPTMVFTAITWNLGLVILIVHMLCTIKASVVAKRETDESSSLMLGFQKVLRGVCDGDVVLQRSSCTIVEDAACLERLLKSGRKLQDTNFLDLFLDVQSRDAFKKFLAADAGASLPTGLRVSLQGANGPVSMDLFHTRIVRDGAGGDYSLLAMKEDADELSRAIPDAQETQNPSLPHTERGPGARSASSASHVVEGYDELVQFSLLVNNSTDMLDIQEARLTFNRCCLLPTLESGMPTLRRFIRATDWHRIEAMIRNVAELPAEDKHAQCYFRHPMLFRIPGESRSYLRSHDTFVTLADTAIVPGTPTRFWVCFSCFDESQFRRPRLQDLDEIPEERVETGEHFQEVSGS
eukprot:Skav209797  [mRNA]  locus=scaffold1201:209212:214227:- [translate_table: standard]